MNTTSMDTTSMDTMRAPLLLHSLAEFRELIFPCLEVAQVRTVVEIGSEEGTFTRELAAWAEANDARVYAVEPAPTPALRELDASSEALHLVEASSPGALEDIEPADAYLIDGDHNYATVLAELTEIDRRNGERQAPYLVFLHDVGWPCGRRDTYYSPESLSPDAVHPFTYDHGLTIGCSQVVRGGFRGMGEFAVAVEEGGPANGVLTAVEDFLEGRQELALVRVPCIFGLGVVFDTSATYAEALAELLAPYDGNPLLARLEENRLSLYLKVLEVQDVNDQLVAGLEKAHLRIRDLEAENRALWARAAELEATVAEVSGKLQRLAAEATAILNSRAFSVAEQLSRVRGRAGRAHGPGLSSDRLRVALEEAGT